MAFTVCISHGDTSALIEYDGDGYSPDIATDLIARAADGLRQAFAALVTEMGTTDG